MSPSSSPEIKIQPYDVILPFTRVEFQTYDSTTLRGNLYHSPSRPLSTKTPIIILIHGLGLLKEQYLQHWTQQFLSAGYHVLTYDHRSFGDSDGLPRNDFNWRQQAEDFIDAVSFVRGLEGVDREKVFGWGVAHAGGVVGMAAAMDSRIAGIIMFLPSIDGAWDKSRWGDAIWQSAKKDRLSGDQSDGAAAKKFWPLTEDDAAGGKTGGSVLSGDYVREWSVVAQEMAQQGNNSKDFTGELTLGSFWNDFHTRPADDFDKITTPVLWVMATDDVVCGPLEATRSLYDSLGCPKEICVLEGGHLPQYFGTGFERSVQAMLGFLGRHAR